MKTNPEDTPSPDNIEACIEKQQFHNALKLLNEGSNCRFTSIFAFKDDKLHNAQTYDRENPDVTQIEGNPGINESYCTFVKESNHNFIVTDSTADPRVKGHVKEFVFRSYCGVPIHDEQGKLWGTLCYFDAEPNRVNEAQINLLQKVAQQLRSQLNELP